MSTLITLAAIRGVTLSAPVFLFALFALACTALAIIVYQRTLPPVGTPRRRLLAAIRALVLVLILFLIFEPVLRWLDRRDERAKILLLVDKSASMGISDNGIIRDSVLADFLNRSEIKALAADGELRSFVFGDSAVQTTLDSAQVMPPALVGSDPAKAWQIARSATSSEDIGAIVLLTDGAHNMGPNPERAATESGIPIHTVGIGDTVLRRDVLIADLLTNDIAYKGTQVPVRVRVRGQGGAGAVTRLRLLDSKSRTLLDENISFDGSLFEQNFDASLTADSEGEIRVTAVIDTIANEVTAENNRRSKIVRVLDSKYNVLLLASSPSADVTFVRQTLGLDTTVEVESYVEVKGGFVNGKTYSEDVVSKTDLFVFVNYPAAGSNRQLWDDVSKRLVEDGVPLLYQHGPAVSQSSLSRIAARLPVEFQPDVSFERVVLREGESHAALSGRGPLPAGWPDLPPALGAVDRVSAKPSAVTVATFANELTPSVNGGPAVVLSELNRRRCAAITTFETYRWTLGLARSPQASVFQRELLSRLTAWLLAPTEEKQFILSTDKKVYSTGEPVRMQGQVYGADLTPVNDASVLVEVKQGDRKEVVSLRSKGNGLYESQFSAWESGDYSFAGSAVLRSDTLGKDDGGFVVEAFNLEWMDSRARWDILQGISQNSGGVFVTASQPDSLFRYLQLPSRVIENSREIPLWNKPYFLWILIGLLAVEWLLRKRSGML